MPWCNSHYWGQILLKTFEELDQQPISLVMLRFRKTFWDIVIGTRTSKIKQLWKEIWSNNASHNAQKPHIRIFIYISLMYALLILNELTIAVHPQKRKKKGKNMANKASGIHIFTISITLLKLKEIIFSKWC